MSRLALALDCGLMTGWASTVAPWEVTRGVRTEEIGEPLAVPRLVEEWIEDHRGYELVVVAERFTINAATGKKTAAPWTLRINGAVEYVCHRASVPYLEQTPGDAKRFCDNSRLRALGFWHRGGEGHANDAGRHLALLLAKARDPWMVRMLEEGA